MFSRDNAAQTLTKQREMFNRSNVGQGLTKQMSMAQRRVAQLPSRRQTRRRGFLAGSLIGLTAGAAGMFILDPRAGRRRRALVRDQVVHFGHVLDDVVSETVPKKVEYLTGFAKGMGHQMSEPASGQGQQEDSKTITDRVMSEVFRDPSLPKGDINVNTVDHVVYLHGHTDNEQVAKEIEQRVRNVEGVRDVVNLINRPDVDPSAIHPGLRDQLRDNPGQASS